MEEECGNVEEARRLLRRGSRVDPSHLYIWQAWGCLEYRQRQYETGRQRGLVLIGGMHSFTAFDPCIPTTAPTLPCPTPPTLPCPCLPPAARELFQQGIWAAPPRAPSVALIFQAWALLERDASNTDLARELLKCAVKADPRSEPSWRVSERE